MRVAASEIRQAAMKSSSGGELDRTQVLYFAALASLSQGQYLPERSVG